MSTKLIALILATYASEDGSRIFPGRERLAAVAGLSTRQVTRALLKLEDLGLVFKVHDGRLIGKRGLASVYQLTVPKMLSTLYAEDKDELVQLVHEAAYDFHLVKVQVTPVSVGLSDLVTPVSHASTQNLVPSEVDLVPSETNLLTSEANLVTRMSPHHVSLTKDLSSSISHQSIFAAASPSVTHASEPVDKSNGTYSGAGMEDERRRQMAALQKIIDDEKRISA